MTDTFEFTLDNPLTEEQWDMITDVDFDRTDRIAFRTKHGKEVEFAKVIRCKDCKRCQNSTVLICGKPKEIFYCDGARKMAVAQYDYCSWAERKEE